MDDIYSRYGHVSGFESRIKNSVRTLPLNEAHHKRCDACTRFVDISSSQYMHLAALNIKRNKRQWGAPIHAFVPDHEMVLYNNRR